MKKATYPWFITAEKFFIQFFIFIIPFSLRHITEHPFTLTAIPIYSIVLVIMTIIGYVLGGLHPHIPRNKSLLICLGLLVAAMLYGGLVNPPLRNAYGLWIIRLGLPILSGWIVYIFCQEGYLTITDCLMPILLSLLGLALVSVAQIGGIIPFENPGRLTATYNDLPITFARYVSYAALVLLPWIGTAYRQKKLFIGGSIVLILSGLMILGSLSFDAIFSLVPALLLLILLWPPQQLAWRTKTYILVGFVLLFSLLTFGLSKTSKWNVSFSESLATRAEFREVAIDVIHDHFWTGIGLKGWEDTYSQLVQRYIVDRQHRLPLNWGSGSTHNVFLDGFVKAGLPGFVGETAFLILPLLLGLQLWRKKGRDDWYALSLIGLAVFMLIFSQFHDPFWSDDTMPFLMIVYFLAAYKLDFGSA